MFTRNWSWKKEKVGDESYRKIYLDLEFKTVSIVIKFSFFFEELVDKFFNNEILIK